MKSNNPLLTHENLATVYRESSQGNTMTLNGALVKITASLLLMISAGILGYLTSFSQLALFAAPICAITAIICVFATTWNKSLSPISVPLYAVTQGFFLGIISFTYAAEYNAILLPAFGLTIGTLAGMLLLFKLQFIKATDQFYSAILAATFGVFILKLLQSFMYFFGITKSFNNFGALGLIVQLVVVGVAALNLIIDFDVIVKSSQKNLPKYMEWYSAMILMVTLVWLYVEILKLIAQIARRK